MGVLYKHGDRVTSTLGHAGNCHVVAAALYDFPLKRAVSLRDCTCDTTSVISSDCHHARAAAAVTVRECRRGSLMRITASRG